MKLPTAKRLKSGNWRIQIQIDGWDGKGDTTSRDGIKRADIRRNVELIEYCAMITDRDILRYVTEGISLPVELRYSYKRFFFVVKHMRFRDRINARKIVEAALASFAMMEGAAGKPLNEDWNFKW